MYDKDAIEEASAWGAPGAPVKPRERISSSETMTQPTGGLGRQAGRALRLSANAAAMNRAFASEEKRITPPPWRATGRSDVRRPVASLLRRPQRGKAEGDRDECRHEQDPMHTPSVLQTGFGLCHRRRPPSVSLGRIRVGFRLRFD